MRRSVASAYCCIVESTHIHIIRISKTSQLVVLDSSLHGASASSQARRKNLSLGLMILLHASLGQSMIDASMTSPTLRSGIGSNESREANHQSSRASHSFRKTVRLNDDRSTDSCYVMHAQLRSTSHQLINKSIHPQSLCKLWLKVIRN